mgnify:CR=1 FL=1
MDAVVIVIGGIILLWALATSQKKGFWFKLVLGGALALIGVFIPTLTGFGF